MKTTIFFGFVAFFTSTVLGAEVSPITQVEVNGRKIRNIQGMALNNEGKVAIYIEGKASPQLVEIDSLSKEALESWGITAEIIETKKAALAEAAAIESAEIEAERKLKAAIANEIALRNKSLLDKAKNGKPLDIEDWEKILKGLTANEVLALLGKPDSTNEYDNNWKYFGRVTKPVSGTNRDLWMHFGPEGTVVFAHYSG